MTDKPTNLYTALLAFQRAVGPVKKDASNPAFRTKYATLQSVLETVEGPLSDNGLVLLQRFQASDHGPMLITEIVHAESGQSVSSAIDVVGKDMADPQKVGGAITYYRRYSLLALLGLAPEDDDGNAASKPPPPRQQPRPEPLNAAPVGSPYNDAERERLARQVRRNDEALSPAEYQRHHELEALAKQQPRPAPAAPMNKPEFEHLIEDVWTMVENGKPYADIVAKLQARRERMNDDQATIVRAELPKLKAAIAERAAPAIAG